MTHLLVHLPATVLPETVMHTEPVRILSTFVAMNTLMYAALAVSKALPKVYPSQWLGRRHTRAEDRSIYPHR